MADVPVRDKELLEDASKTPHICSSGKKFVILLSNNAGMARNVTLSHGIVKSWGGNLMTTVDWTASLKSGRIIAPLACAFLITGCGTVHGPASDLFSGYTALEPPRAVLAVGAAWVPALDSTTGPGLPTKSLSTATTTNVKLKSGGSLNVGATLTKFLGFSAGGTHNVDVGVGDAEIVSVSDLADLPIAGAARTFVHSGVRVKSFNIQSNSSMNAEIRNAVIAKLNLVDGNVTAKASGVTEVKGANLFVAYKTVAASQPKSSVKNLDITYDQKNKVSLRGFTLTAWSRFTYPCNEGPRVYWLVQSDQHMDGGTTLNRMGFVELEKKPSQEFPSTPYKQLFDVSSDKVLPIYKGLEGNKVLQVQVRFAYDGLEVVDVSDNNKSLCRLVSANDKRTGADLMVVEYTLESQ